VVAAAVGGLPYAIGDGGLLIDGHRTADWSAGLEGLLDDPGRRDLMSRKAVEHASHFSWERTTDQLLEVYTESVIARATPPIDDTSSPMGAGGLSGVPAAVIP
jgi:D-inositol-3-phosphate glycosyltransferase